MNERVKVCNCLIFKEREGLLCFVSFQLFLSCSDKQ